MIMNRLFECQDCPFRERNVPAHEGTWTLIESDIPGLAWCKGVVYYKPPFIFHMWPSDKGLKFGMAYIYPDHVDAMLTYGRRVGLGWVYNSIYGNVEPEWID